MSKPRITIRFEEEVYETVQKLAQEQDRSINWIVNYLLTSALRPDQCNLDNEKY